MYRLLVIALFLLAACGEPDPLIFSSYSVLHAFDAAGVSVTDVRRGRLDPSIPIPNSYVEHVDFLVPGLSNTGGQFFICVTKKDCDPIVDALKNLTGSYIYQSGGGHVVLQLSGQLTSNEAAKFARAIKPLP